MLGLCLYFLQLDMTLLFSSCDLSCSRIFALILLQKCLLSISNKHQSNAYTSDQDIKDVLYRFLAIHPPPLFATLFATPYPGTTVIPTLLQSESIPQVPRTSESTIAFRNNLAWGGLRPSLCIVGCCAVRGVFQDQTGGCGEATKVS